MSQLKIQFSNEYFEQRKWLCDINAVVLQVLWENTRNRNWRRCDQDLRSDNTIQNHRSVALKRKFLETDFLGSLFIRTRFIENKPKRTSFYGLCTTSILYLLKKLYGIRTFSLFNILFCKQKNGFSTGRNLGWSMKNLLKSLLRRRKNVQENKIKQP